MAYLLSDDLSPAAGGEERTRLLNWLDALLLKITLPQNPRALEFGCGDGATARLVAEHLRGRGRLTAIDSRSRAVRAARARTDPARFPHLEYRTVTTAALPFGAGEFDFAFCVQALIHVEHPQRVLGELARVLKPGGQFLAVEPDLGGYFLADLAARDSRQAPHLNPYIARALPGLCSAAGLTPTDLFPNFVVSREPLTRELLEGKDGAVRTLRPHLRDIQRLDLDDYLLKTERAVRRQTDGGLATLIELAVLARKD